MKVTYKGLKGDLSPKLQEKLDAKFGKVAKLLDGRGEKSAHVMVTNERHLHRAEITVRFYDHELVCEGSDGDLFTAVAEALTKLEKQAVKQRGRWREKTRRADTAQPAGETAAERAPAERDADGERLVHRVNHHKRRKPMTLEEAVIQMETGLDYLVYRDAERECVSVLIRRRDGHFDLIES